MRNQVIINGLLLGGVYAQLTIGLTLIFGVMDIPNFAHGEFLMLGLSITFLNLSLIGFAPKTRVISTPNRTMWSCFKSLLNGFEF